MPVIGRRSGWRPVGAALVLSMLLAASATGATGSAGRPGERWARGQLLVRFNAGVGGAQRSRLVHAAGAHIEGELPLVPNLWELDTAGSVSHAVARLNDSRGVAYAQPDWIVNNQPEAAPDQAGYWPNDPYFWSASYGDPNGCGGSQSSMTGWPFWPALNLTDSQLAVQQFNPLAADQRAERIDGQPRFASYHSIDVLPVWNLLLDEGKLWNGQDGELSRGIKRVGPWTREQIEQYGIGIMDTGISNSPDVAPELAAQFSVVGYNEGDSNNPVLVNKITQTYSDNPARDDFELVRQALGGEANARLISALRPLFVLDDTNELTPKKWSPLEHGNFGAPILPRGCDGHGTEVASVAGARANNKTGTAGVAYDAPLVGLRVGEPWDQRLVNYANNQNLKQALTAWNSWHQRAVETDSSLVNELAIVRALKLPIVNMSFGAPMLRQRPDAQGHQHPVIADPSLAEAYARTLSTGTTLGVTAAGNDGQQFGRAPSGQGADTTEGSKTTVTAPCGLPLIPKLGVWVQANPGAKNSVAAHPYRPADVNWNRIQMICVGGTTYLQSQLWHNSGRGDAAVDLVAPGVGITVAARASAADPDSAGAYVNVDGTSFASPMVAGAASLLRRVAPDALMSQIRLALERGARRAEPLFGQVRYGHLDVACSLAWLGARNHQAETFLLRAKQIDPPGYEAFEQATQGCQRIPYWSTDRLSVPKAELFDAREGGRSFLTMQALIDQLKLNSDPTSNSMRWQNSLLLGSGAEWNGGRAVFQIGRLFHPLAPPARQVFGMGFLALGCRPGYAITRLHVAFDNVIKPNRAWVLPTDSFAPTRQIELAVGVAKPSYASFLGQSIKLSAEGRCEYFGTGAK